jgi:hypothetical protein
MFLVTNINRGPKNILKLVIGQDKCFYKDFNVIYEKSFVKNH